MHLAERLKSQDKRAKAVFASIVATCVLAVILACGGTTAVAPLPQCAHNSASLGCYGIVRWNTGTADISGAAPTGMYTSIDVAPITCPGSCSAAGEYIANYMAVVGSGPNWVEAGYARATTNENFASGGSTDLEYFDGWRLGASDIVHYHPIGSASGDTGHYTNFALYRTTNGALTPPTRFVVRVKSTFTATNLAPTDLYIPSPWAATHIEMGQIFSGPTNDKAAQTAWYSDTHYATSTSQVAAVSGPVDYNDPGHAYQNYFSGNVASDGHILMGPGTSLVETPPNPVNGPPFASWFDKPVTGSGILHTSGGWFYVECCQPL